VASFKKQFAAQEAEALRQRTSPRPGGSGAPTAECLVALDAGGGVIACADLRLPAAAVGAHPEGVPAGDARGAYILNVVVRPDCRGAGVGRALMAATVARALGAWAAGSVYTAVAADNDVAFRLYRGAGFAEHKSDGGTLDGALDLGRTVLLVYRPPAADAS
jgi:ribosomal protein S18 acetylase RimI-like enzyme